MKNKCTLLVDSNWLNISRVSVMIKRFNKDLNKIQLDSAKEDLMDMLAKSINVILNRFPVIDNIVLMADGGSWRKQLSCPDAMKDIIYKGNRTLLKKDETDWGTIWSSLNDMLGISKDVGITVSQYNNIEGDDWAWYWSRRLNSEGINTIIWSSDCDLKQLVGFDEKTNAWTVWYNAKNGLVLSDEMDNVMTDDIYFFMNPVFEDPLIETLKKNVNNDVHYINPDEVVMSKIICGDGGDNIKSVVRWEKNGRVYRFSEKEWEKLRESLDIRSLEDFFANKSKIITGISNNKKLKGYDIKEDDIRDMIDYNTNLVWLNENTIPESIIQSMNEVEYKDFDISFIRLNYKILCEREDKMNEIEDIFNS